MPGVLRRSPVSLEFLLQEIGQPPSSRVSVAVMKWQIYIAMARFTFHVKADSRGPVLSTSLEKSSVTVRVISSSDVSLLYRYTLTKY